MKRLPVFALLAFAAVACGQRYRVTNLGTLGGSDSEAFGIDASGEVVGDAYTPAGAQHAFLFTGGAMDDLGTTNGALDSVGNAVNGLGHVVGQLAYDGGSFGTFEYANGSMTAYDLFTAQGINDSGQIVGWANLPNGYNVYAYVLHNGVVTNLGMPPGYTDAKA